MMDPYQVLGVDRTADHEDIAKAYRSLAAKYHPDKNPDDPSGAAQKFKEVTAAFEIIGTQEKRRNYDFYGNKVHSFNFRSRNAVDDVFDNIFSQFFGDQRRGSQGSKVRVKISLREAFLGCEKKVQTERRSGCSECKGTGASLWDSCSGCAGKGFVLVGHGGIKVQSACSICQGRGSVPSKRCQECNGRGYMVDEVKEINVKIPPGIGDNNQVRLAGEAGDGSDLFVIVNVEKDSNFTRQDNFLFGAVDVPYTVLVMGGVATLDVFGTSVSIKIPPRTTGGSRMRVKGQGMPTLQNPAVRGDLFVDLRLKVPKFVSEKHARLLEALAKIEEQD